MTVTWTGAGRRMLAWRAGMAAVSVALTMAAPIGSAHAAPVEVMVDAMGAVADGQTDCRAAIQKAFAQVKQAGGGAVRFRPGGVYVISDTIGSADAADRFDGVTVDGSGATIVCALVQQPRPALRLMGSNLLVRDLTVTFAGTIDPVKDAYAQGGDAIYIGGTHERPEHDIRVDRCVVKQAWFAGVRPIYASRVAVTDCRFDRCLATSIFVGDVLEDIQITGNMITNTKDDGIYVNCGKFAPAVRGVIISGNTIRVSSAKGIGLGGVHDAVVLGNTIDTTWGPGIVCEQTGYSPDKTRNIRIAGNMIRDAGRNFGAGKYHATANPVGAGIYVTGSDPTDFGAIQIDGNQITGAAACGVQIAHASLAQVTGNMISAGGGSGIVAGAERGAGPQLSNFVIARNVVTDVAQSGIYVVGASHGTVDGNVVRSYGGPGAPVDRGVFVYRSDGVVVSGNLVDNDRKAEETLRVASCTASPVMNSVDMVDGAGLDGGVFATGTRRLAWGTTAPMSGAWTQGDIVLNTVASSASVLGWQCAEGGTPGVWRELRVGR